MAPGPHTPGFDGSPSGPQSGGLLLRVGRLLLFAGASALAVLAVPTAIRAQPGAVDTLGDEPEQPPVVDTFVGPRIRSALGKIRHPPLPGPDSRAADVPPPEVGAGEIDPARIPNVPSTSRERMLRLGRGSSLRSSAPEPPRRWVDPLVRRLFPSLVQASYAGDARCLECHEAKKDDWRRSVYGLVHYDRSLPRERRGCEGCHGPGSEHARGGAVEWIVNPAKLDRRPLVAVCFSCHADERLVRRQGWQFSQHGEALVGCLDCHSIHHSGREKALVAEPNRLCLRCHRDQEASFSMTSHHPLLPERVDAQRSTVDGKIRCVDCHRVHAALNPRLIRGDRSDTCLACHPEFRGPFLFQHGGLEVLADGCMTCHLPHGSPNRSLMTRPDRALCITCHTDRMTHGGGSSCFSAMGCHNEIHGSNKNRLMIGAASFGPTDTGLGRPGLLE